MGGKSSKSTQTSTTNPSTVYAPQGAGLENLYGQAQNTYNQQSGQVYTPGGKVKNPNYIPPGSQQGGLSMEGMTNGQFGSSRQRMLRTGLNTTDEYIDAPGTWGPGGGKLAGENSLDQFQQLLQQAQGQFGTSQNQFNQAAQGYGQGITSLNDQAAWLKQFQNPGMDPMADVYARQVGQQFNEQIMPGLRGGAALSGGMGSSRQGIAEGLAAGRSSQQLQDFGAQLYGQQQDRSLQAAMGLGQNALGYGQLANGQGNLGAQMGQLGEAMSGLGGQYGSLSQMQQALPWYALNQYKGLLGNPTVLGGGGSSSGTATGGSESQIGNIVKIAGLVAAPFTGGASLAVTAGASAAGL